MASEKTPTSVQDPTQVTDETAMNGKGKGKAVATEEPVNQAMDEDDDDDSGDEEGGDDVEEDDEEDNMDEIDTNNIVDGGRRTRGRVIDWAKAAQENPADDDDDDDEDEDDFEPGQGEADGDKMDED